MPAGRRDDEGKLEVGPTWESLVDRQIREAMEDGAFDDLPHQGAPLPLEDDSAAGAWALAFRMLRNAGVAPPWIEADKDVRAWLARRDEVLAQAGRSRPSAGSRLRGEMTRIVTEANRAIERLNAEAPTDRQHRRPLHPERELEALEAALRG